MLLENETPTNNATTNMSSVFVLVGHTGKFYDDHLEWMVCAYRTEQQAVAHGQILEQLVAQKLTDDEIRSHPHGDKQFCRTTTPTTYSVQELEMR